MCPLNDMLVMCEPSQTLITIISLDLVICNHHMRDYVKRVLQHSSIKKSIEVTHHIQHACFNRVMLLEFG
jgi:hypothetical protein